MDAKKLVTKQKFNQPSVGKLDRSSRPSGESLSQNIKDLKRIGNPTILAKLRTKYLANKKKKADGEEWSRLRRESPSTGKGVGY